MVALAGLGACAETPGPTGPQVEIKVAPVNYPGINKVCYDITVLNGAPTPGDGDTSNDPDVVWHKAGICSNDYGNLGGGDISYVGPCDASVAGHNYVELTLADVWVGATSPVVLKDQVDLPDGDPDYENPCPTGAPCVLDFECLENADVLVEFNLVIMRDADQGWFDIAVNFDDIFCSAKFDTCYPGDDPGDKDDDEPIRFLHDRSGERKHTAVLGFACTGGPLGTPGAAPETHLYMNDIVITCPPAGMQAELLALNAEIREFLTVDILGDQGLLAGRFKELADKDLCLENVGTDPTPCDPLPPVTSGSVDLQRSQLTLISEALVADAEYFLSVNEQLSMYAALGQDVWTWPVLRARVGLTGQILDYVIYPEVADEVADFKATYQQILAMVSPITLSPSAGDGNIYTTETSPAIGYADSGQVWQYAVYAGQEQLTCGVGPVTFSHAGVDHPVFELTLAGVTSELVIGGDATAGFSYYPLVDGSMGPAIASPYPASWGAIDPDTGIPEAWVRKVGPISCDKVYWNVAIGIEGLPAGCVLSTSATASADALVEEIGPVVVGGLTPERTMRPVIDFVDIPLTSDDGDVVCGQYPLDTSGYVKARYTSLDAQADYGHHASQLPGGGLLLSGLDPDDNPRSITPYQVPLAGLTLADSLGSLVHGSTYYRDRVDFHGYQLPASGPANVALAYSCTSNSSGFDIYYRFFNAKGEGLMEGYQECDGTPARLNRPLLRGELVYAVYVGSGGVNEPPGWPDWPMYHFCREGGGSRWFCFWNTLTAGPFVGGDYTSLWSP